MRVVPESLRLLMELSKKRRAYQRLKQSYRKNMSDNELSEFLFELEMADFELASLDEQRLVPIAERWGIDVPDDSWKRLHGRGPTFLKFSTRAKLWKVVRDERFLYWSRWAQLLVPILSLIVAALAIIYAD